MTTMTSSMLSRSSSGTRKTVTAAAADAVGSDMELRDAKPSPPHPCDARVRSVVFCGDPKIADVGGLAVGSSSPFIGREQWTQLLLSAPTSDVTADGGKRNNGSHPVGRADVECNGSSLIHGTDKRIDNDLEAVVVPENEILTNVMGNGAANGTSIPISDVSAEVSETNATPESVTPSPSENCSNCWGGRPAASLC